MSGLTFDNPYSGATNSYDSQTQPLDVVVQNAIDAYLRERVRVMVPGYIVNVRNPSFVDVQPIPKRRYKSGSLVDMPVVQNVPVIGSAGASWWIKYPLAKGDPGNLIIADRALDAWLAGSSASKTVDPGDMRIFDMTDAEFLPGVRISSQPLPQGPNATDMIVHNGAAEIHVQQAGTFAFTNGTNELMSLLYTLLTDLISAQVVTSIGPQPFTPTTIQALQQLQTKLKTLVGT